MYRLRCRDCGKFIGFKNPEAITYVPWGSSYDLSPPDPEYLCGKCYELLTNREKESLENGSWIKPYKFFNI